MSRPLHPRPRRTAFGVASLLIFTALTLVAPSVGADQSPTEEQRAPPPVMLRIIAPSARGLWLLRLDNVGDDAVRLAADARLLRLEVTAPQPAREEGSPARTRWRPPPKTTVCDGPSAFGLTDRFPGRRELVLAPGRSYVEEFDPRLICFGKDAASLVPGARVKVHYGWTRSAKARRTPFVADGADRPRRYRPLERLEAPTMVLSHGSPVVYGPAPARLLSGSPASSRSTPGTRRRGASSGTGGARPPPSEPLDGEDLQPRSAVEASVYYRPRRAPSGRVQRRPRDALGAALTLTADHFADGAMASDLRLSVQAHNTGERPVFVALRSRMLSFRVLTPSGRIVTCDRQSMGHHVPRDLFGVLQPGKHKHLNVRLAEVCPPRVFSRPGLYGIVPTLHADADGAEYGLSALTGVVTVRDEGAVGGTHVATDDMTLVRVTRGRRPAYRSPPRSLPTRIIASAPPEAAAVAP
ncbi:MAG: hypothetical protein AAGN82_15140 [Myxococcota bacterium]